MTNDLFTRQTAGLRALGGRRVWSLMVSLFGDLAQNDGDAIDGPVLSAIMDRLQVKPEAVRVALHRLRNEGWISSTKSGRISIHQLTAQGSAESAAASPRIYAAPGMAEQGWQLVVLPHAGTEISQQFTLIAPRIYIGPATVPAPKHALSFDGDQVPDWLRAQAAPTAFADDYTALNLALCGARQMLPAPGDMTPLDVAALRCLIVHNWRRLVLKHPVLPAPLISSDWPGHQCHLLVADLLDRYTRPMLNTLDQRHAA